MGGNRESRYSRLELDGEYDGVDHDHARNHGANPALLRWSLLINAILTLAVIALGAGLSLQHHNAAMTTHVDEILTGQLLAEQYGVSGKNPTTYKYLQDGFDDDDFEKGDPYWAELFPKGNGLVFLSDEKVEAYRLPPSAKAPGGGKRGNHSLYESAGYHSLHCLSSVRAGIAKLLRAQGTSQPYVMDEDVWRHFKHCLADARQALLCHFDETLLIGHDAIHPGIDQTKLCKDLGPINKWLEDHYIPPE